MSSTGFLRYENRLIVILTLTFGVVFFDRNAMAYLAPFVAPDLGLTNTQIGMLASALSLTWAVSAFGIGALSDATGRRKSILIAAIVVFSLSSVLSGLAGSFLVLLASRMLMGLSEGGILPISQSLLAVESSAARRGLNMGVMQTLGAALLGSFAAPLVLVALAESYHWRVAFYVAAVPGLICAALVALYVREPGRREAVPAHAAAPAGRRHFRELFGYRNIWLCSLISCFMVAWMVLGWTFLPLFYVNARGIASSDMSVLMSVLGVSAAVCGFLVPGLSDRLGRKPVMIAFTLIGVVVPIAALYWTGPLWALGALVFVGWSAAGTFAVFMATIPAETVPERYVATALGLVVGIGEIVGGVLSPTAAGRAADRFGLEAPLFIMIACALAATLLALFLRETAPVKVGARTAAAPDPTRASAG